MFDFKHSNNQSMKRIITAFVSIFCFAQVFAQTFVEGDFSYSFIDSTEEVSVRAVSNKIAGDVTIPTIVKYKGCYYVVSKIEDGGFKECNEIRKLTLPNGLRTIGNEAFLSCNGITDLSLPHSVVSIGRDKNE